MCTHPACSQLVTPVVDSGFLPLATFAELCYATRGLAGVSLACVLGTLAAKDLDAVRAAGVHIARAMGPGKTSAVVTALGAAAPLYPEVPAVADLRKALQRNTPVDDLLTAYASLPDTVRRSADYAVLVGNRGRKWGCERVCVGLSLSSGAAVVVFLIVTVGCDVFGARGGVRSFVFHQVVSEVCQYVFFGPAGEDVDGLTEELKPYGRLLLRVVAEAQVSSTTVCSDVLDAVVSYAESEPVKGAWPRALVLF